MPLAAYPDKLIFMARFTRIQVVSQMYQTALVPVFYHPELQVCQAVLQACYQGGVRVFEFTNRGDYAHELFSSLNKYAAQHCPELMLGIGSVADGPTAALYLQLGANFVVSHVLNPEVAKVCNRRKVSWSPGCGSLSEISYAEELGAEVVKIFPASEVGGPSFVKAVRAPSPWSSIMPTGGVSPTQENLKQWFEAGVHCVGMGSQLITKDILSRKDYAALTEKCQQALQIIKQLRA